MEHWKVSIIAASIATTLISFLVSEFRHYRHTDSFSHWTFYIEASVLGIIVSSIVYFIIFKVTHLVPMGKIIHSMK